MEVFSMEELSGHAEHVGRIVVLNKNGDPVIASNINVFGFTGTKSVHITSQP